MIQNSEMNILLPTEENLETQRQSNQQTAKKALAIVQRRTDLNLIIQFNNQFRNRLAAAFALDGKIVYGRAFDAIICETDQDILSMDVEGLHSNLHYITLCEIKSTNRKIESFKGYFFSISTAEILVAQSLGNKFKFIFVNVNTNEMQICSLEEVYSRAKAIYPTWSITLKGF